MCGIVGIVGTTEAEDVLRKMNDVQRHRGPDDEGYFFAPEARVALAMRRLSILDLSGGHQPMRSASRDHCIVFNGEIFNAPLLRRELEQAGQVFQTDHSDTEVLLHLYGRLGEEMLGRLNGMFAFVIYDGERRRLFGARDRFGIKPLYYARDGNRFAFASELKSLRETPWVDTTLDRQALGHYLSFQCIPAPHSPFQAIRKIPAGHSFSYALGTGELRIARYWQPRFAERLDGPSPADLPAYVRRELIEAVKRWMLSDVPVGFSLSGGIDSATIVGILSGEIAGARPRTYSLGFADAPDLDETDLARLVARRWGTEHQEIILREDELLAALDRMVDHLEEPYGGGLPSWFVFEVMSRDVKVAMTGTGGDEVFGNYGKWLPYESVWSGLKMSRQALRRGSSAWDVVRHRRGSLYPLYFRQAQKSRLLTSAMSEALEPSEALVARLWRDSAAANPRDAISAIDFALQLPEEFLHMTDRFSMAHGLEARTPFLDHEFVEKMLRIPTNIRTRPGGLKHLLIESVRDLLPAPLLEARKRGFVLPMGQWLRTKLRDRVEEFFAPSYLRDQGVFETGEVRRLVDGHLSGKRDYTWQVWTLFLFQCWYERCVRQARGASPSRRGESIPWKRTA